MAQIAFATWRAQPEMTSDDRLAIAPLRDRGIHVESVPWRRAWYGSTARRANSITWSFVTLVCHGVTEPPWLPAASIFDASSRAVES
jgi:hypothetical protein